MGAAIRQFRDVISDNTSTLFFTNSRRLAEKITLKINQDQMEPLPMRTMDHWPETCVTKSRVASNKAS